MSSKKKALALLQFYDYRQMFDAINMEQALSDLYDCGVDDDNLAILYDILHEWRDMLVSPKSNAKKITKIIFLPFKPSYICELALDLTYRVNKIIRQLFSKEL